MADNRLLREGNPTPGTTPGFVPQHVLIDGVTYVKTGEGNPLPTKLTGSSTQDVTFQNAVSTTGNGTVFNVGGYHRLNAILSGSSKSRNVVFEFSMDGTTWEELKATKIADGTISSNISNLNETWQMDISGLYQVRSRVSSLQGEIEVASLDITADPTTTGNVTVTLDGVATDIAIDPAVETTASDVADKIRSTSFTGWTTGGTGSNVTFTSTSDGNKTDATYSDGGTGATGTMTTTTQGTTPSLTVDGKAVPYGTAKQNQNVQLMGSNMKEMVLGENVLLSPGTSTFTNPTGGADVRDSNELSWAVQSSSAHDYEIALHWKGEKLSGNFKIDRLPQTVKNKKSDRLLTFSPFVSLQVTNNSLDDQTYDTAFYKYSGIPQYTKEA
jgi:hypothetical protein